MPDAISRIQRHLSRQFYFQRMTIVPIPHGVINSNYRIETPGQTYLFKIYNLSNGENVAFELSILDFLSTKDFPCPRIVSDRRQRLFHFMDDKPAVLLEYLPGRMITDITFAQMRRIGAGVGRFHRLLKDFRQPLPRVTWEVNDIGRHIINKRWHIIEKKYPDGAKFVASVAKAFQELDLPENLPQGMTHQDVKPENIIIDNSENISFIDFNDCYRGTLLVDVMTMPIWSCFRGDVLDVELFRAYVKGYIRERPLASPEKTYFYPMFLFRLLREAFVWPMRFSPDVAYENGEAFLRRYHHMAANGNGYQEMISSLLAES